MKVLLIILDGLGDWPSEELGGKTPLEAAHTPHLDRLATLGVNGLMDPVAPGVPSSTPISHFILFSYDYQGEFPGRALVLAVGRGLEVWDDDVVCAARFSTVSAEGEELRILERFYAYEEEDVVPLAAGITDKEVLGLRFHYHYTGRSDGILVLRGGASPDVTDSDPLGKELPVIKVQPLADAAKPQRAKATARALNGYLSWVHRFLAAHPLNEQRSRAGKLPINFLLTKWAGQRRRLTPFGERQGFRAVTITSDEALLGLAREIGMDQAPCRDLGDPEAELRDRLGLARKLFQEGYDFVHLHTKEPDVSAHFSDPSRKKRAIEALDRGLEPLLAEMLPDRELLVVVTGDHCTPSVWGNVPRGQFHDHHCGEPVPLVAVSRFCRPDGVAAFGERPAAAGGLGRFRGSDLMPLILNMTARTNTLGMQPTPQQRLHRPQVVEPFLVAVADGESRESAQTA